MSAPPDLLTPQELDLWLVWKRAHEVVRRRVVEEITAATGLSDAEFGILFRLSDAGGTLRQNTLASLMGWHRSRLSHQLTRMEDRGWLNRQPVPGGVEVRIDQPGQQIIDTASPIHAAGVRRHLIDLFTDSERNLFHEALHRLNDTNSTPDTT